MRQKLRKTIQRKQKAYWQRIAENTRVGSDRRAIYKHIKKGHTANTTPPQIQGIAEALLKNTGTQAHLRDRRTPPMRTTDAPPVHHEGI